MSIWRNYWTVAVRALAKSKTYSIINIAGLAIGMAACIMILLYIRYEQSYDEWLPDAENTYQFQTYAKDPDSGEEFDMQMASFITRERLEKALGGRRGAGKVAGCLAASAARESGCALEPAGIYAGGARRFSRPQRSHGTLALHRMGRREAGH